MRKNVTTNRPTEVVSGYTKSTNIFFRVCEPKVRRVVLPVGSLVVFSLLKNFGFSVRINSSHHIFYRDGIDEIINLQPEGSKAKPYQVKQIRDLMVKYHGIIAALEENDE